MPSIIAADLIASSLRLIGATAQGETPNATEVRDCLAVLNDMLESWSTEGLAVFASITQSFSLVGGSPGFTLGPSGGVVGTRPITVDSAFVRIGVDDYPLEVTLDEARYHEIAEKSDQGIPGLLFWNPQYPNAEGRVYPIPYDNSMTLTIARRIPFSQVADSSVSIDYPPGYSKAIRYALAVELAPEFQVPLRPDLLQTAMDAKAEIKRVNNSSPTAEIDPAFLCIGR